MFPTFENNGHKKQKGKEQEFEPETSGRGHRAFEHLQPVLHPYFLEDMTEN
jgi:hypothetical protein